MRPWCWHGPGARWLWWTLFWAGLPGFGAALAVHVVVGYDDLWHLAPVLLAVALFIMALALTYPYVCAGAPQARQRAPGLEFPGPWWRPRTRAV